MIVQGWHPSTWSYEHPRHGHFFIQVQRDGRALASRVDGRTVRQIRTDDGDSMHPSLSAALVACELRIREMDAACAESDAKSGRALAVGDDERSGVAKLALVQP